jgi:hypothetical protein
MVLSAQIFQYQQEDSLSYPQRPCRPQKAKLFKTTGLEWKMSTLLSQLFSLEALLYPKLEVQLHPPEADPITTWARRNNSDTC